MQSAKGRKYDKDADGKEDEDGHENENGVDEYPSRPELKQKQK